MKLLINTSAVPFNDPDKQTICTFGSQACPVGRIEMTAMQDDFVGRWISRRELAERYRVPTKTPAEWASKGTDPR